MREFYSSLPSLFRASVRQNLAPPDSSSKVPGVESRVVAFQSQLDSWLQSGRIAVPLLILPDAAPPAEGRCISCSALLEPGQTWRCAACLEAVKITLAEGHR